MSETSKAAPRPRTQLLTPRQAISISLGGLGIGVIALALARTLFLVPLWQAAIGYAIAAFFLLAYPWASLNLETRNRAIHAHNLFVYFTIAIVIVALVVQWKPKEEPFPKCAIVAIIIAGVAAYSVMARVAVANFLKWRHGDFASLNEEPRTK